MYIRSVFVSGVVLAAVLGVLLFVHGHDSVQAQAGGGERVVSRDVVDIRVGSPQANLGGFVLQGEAKKGIYAFPGQPLSWTVLASNPTRESISRMIILEGETSNGTRMDISGYMRFWADVRPDRLRENSVGHGELFPIPASQTKFYFSISFAPRNGLGGMCFKDVSVRFNGLYGGKWIAIETLKLAENLCVKESITKTIYSPPNVNWTGRAVSIRNYAPVDQKVCVLATIDNADHAKNIAINLTVNKASWRVGQKLCFEVSGRESSSRNRAYVEVRLIATFREFYGNVPLAIEVSTILGN